MVSKIFLITSLMSLALVNCEPPIIPPSTQYGTPSSQYGTPSSQYGTPSSQYGTPNAQYGTPNTQYGTPISSYGTPNYNTDHHNQEHNEPKSYEFGYQVKDDYSGNNYKRQEASDGNQVQGEYRVQLPDGRTQIVTYYADWQTGFHADVRYEGEAQYPENYGNGFNGFGGPGFGNVGAQYGPPGYATGHNGGFNLNNFNNPATSAVSIKDYSGAGTPYNVGGYGQGHHHNANNNFQGGYDSYANTGNFGNKVRPSNVYGAP